MGDTNTNIFYYAPAIFLFPISPTKWSIKTFSKPVFHFTRPSTKIIEFDNVNFPASISSEDGVCRKCLEIDITVCFKIMSAFFFSMILTIINYTHKH